MDEVKKVTLIRAAVAGKYGREVSDLAKSWSIRCLLGGKTIPLSWSELYEAYHDFDIAFVAEFMKHQNWYVIWQMSNDYCEYRDRHFVYPRILLELLTVPVEPLVKEQIQNWLLLHTKSTKIAFILLEKAQKYPQLLDWAVCYLAKFEEFPDANNIISLIKRAAKTYPEYMRYAVRLLSCVGASGRGQQLQTVKALVELCLIKDLDDKLLHSLNEEISRQLDTMDITWLRRCLHEGILSAEHRVAIGRRLVNRGYWDSKLIKNISTIYNLSFAQNDNTDKLLIEWNLFIDGVFKHHPEVISELFLTVSEAISVYVEKMHWDVSLMEWNPGMNFQKYSPEFIRMTIKSLDYATVCKQFRPRAFLTALNIWVFDETKVFNEEWFERFVASLSQNNDKSLSWDDDLQQLLNHLALLYRYRVEMQQKDAAFIVTQAKLFIQMLLANYVLNNVQIGLIRNLCVRLNLDIVVELEIAAMDERSLQLQHQKEQEQQYLLELLAN